MEADDGGGGGQIPDEVRQRPSEPGRPGYGAIPGWGRLRRSRPAGPGSGPVRLGPGLHFAGGGCKILRAPAGRRGILMALAGVDVGGTFTDFIVLDGSGSQGMRFFKVPSTPR